MHVPWVLGMRTVASISTTGIPQKSLIDHGLHSFWSHVVRVGWWWSLSPSGSDHDLSNHKRQKPGPDVYGQSLAALPSQSAVSKNGS
uniref:Uncharacterized protein n=1 Tax=Tanacetum cinerariifolium TaxID=118510 RepID=A0A699Q9I8_TANCI|nr:hypothetical protein [Tanacetum cinerariifolium]